MQAHGAYTHIMIIIDIPTHPQREIAISGRKRYISIFPTGPNINLIGWVRVELQVISVVCTFQMSTYKTSGCKHQCTLSCYVKRSESSR
jgi:hypothetical protein